MSERKSHLADLLDGYYRGFGWKVDRVDDGTVRASGPGGVTWIGLPVVEEDLRDDSFESMLLSLSNERTPSGQRCPLELLPAEECAADVRALLAELRLDAMGHVEVYSTAA